MAKILVVDDRPTNREFLTTLLGYGGHQLFEAGDGAEALAIARAERPELIIADILMPTMDGYELVRHLRDDPVIAKTPVIFYTAHYHEKEAQALASACGVSAVLTKPAEPQTILDAVEAALGITSPLVAPTTTEDFDREHLRLITDKLSEKANDLRKTNERLSALVDLGLQLGSELDLRQLLQSFGHAAREIIGARYAITAILGSPEPGLRCVFTSGMHPDGAARLGSPDPRAKILRPVLSGGRCARLQNPSGDATAIGLASTYPPVHALLAAPIESPTRVYGWLCLIDKIGADAFSDEDERLAKMLAAQVGRIYQNGSLYADVLEHAAELEREVSERKRAEQQLRLQGSALDAAADGIAITDVSGNIVWVNPAFTRMTGYRSDEICGQNPRVLKSGKHDQAVYTELWRTIRAGQVWRGEMINRRKDGSLYFEAQTITPVRDERGELTHFIAIKQDITARKRADEALLESQAHMRLVLDTANDPFIAMDAAGKITDWNMQAETTYGWSRDEAIGRDLSETIIPPQYRDAHLRGLKEFLATGKGPIMNQRREFTALHRDGHEFPVELIVWPVKVGSSYFFNAFARDITLRKQAEKAQRERTQCSALAGDVGLALTGAETLRDMLQQCAESMVANLDAAFARIWTLNEAGDILELQASAGMYTHLDGPHGRVPVGKFKIGLIAKERRPHLTNAVVGDPRVGDQDWAVREGMVAFAGYPLLVADRLIGVAALFARQALSDATLQALAGVADQIALGIDRKLAEKVLREREEQVGLLLDSTAEAIYGIDLHGYCTFSNSACLRLLGYATPADLLGKNMHALIHHTRTDGTRYPVEECHIYESYLRNEGTHVEDEVFWRADGSSFPAEYWSHPIRRLEETVGAVVTFLDITERRKLEGQFRQAQERLQHVVSSSPAVLYTLAVTDNTIVGNAWMSENVVDMLGYTVQETIGSDWWLRNIHPDDREQILSEVLKDLFARDRVANEYRFRHKNGEYCWVRSEIRLIRDAAGRPTEAVGSWFDITERKQLEEQYRQAQKMEAVGKLAGGVAHDFNNLLTVIMGYSEIYLGKLRPEYPLRIPLTEIHKAGERATGLTRQLLAFSRKQVLMPVVLDLNTIIADMEKMLLRLIGEDVILSVLAGTDLWKVKADPGQMEQVVMNIMVNARDAMPMGGKLFVETKNVELDNSYVQTHSEAKPGEHVLLAITDSGCGMDASVKARAFEPFFTTKGPTKGTGLGLATVFGIIKQSGGHIEVYSELGQGTTFKIYLPRDKSGEPIALSPRIKEPVRGGTETILLVEDEEGVRALAQTVLQEHGYTVLDARHGGDALVICETRSQPIDLMITDVVMPHFSGRQLAERLATRQPTMKVLFMSGYTDDAIVHHGVLESGMPFLQKPFAPEALARKVREVLDSKPGSIVHFAPDNKTGGNP